MAAPAKLLTESGGRSPPILWGPRHDPSTTRPGVIETLGRRASPTNRPGRCCPQDDRASCRTRSCVVAGSGGWQPWSGRDAKHIQASLAHMVACQREGEVLVDGGELKEQGLDSRSVA